MNPYLKLVIPLGIILMFFISCEKETYVEEIKTVESQTSNFSIKRINKDRIQKNKKLSDKLETLSSKLNQNVLNKTTAKGKYIKEYDFTIVTELATYIQEDSYHSYTFPIKQSSYENIKNVLFSLNENNEYDAFLINYDYSYSDLLNVSEASELSDKTKMTPIDLDFNALTQKITSFWVCSYDYIKVDADKGELDGDNDTIWRLTMDCSTIWGTITEDDDYFVSTNSGGNTGSSQTSNYSASGGFVSSPTFSVYDDEDLGMYHILDNELDLNPLEYNCLYQNYGTAEKAFKYLEANNYSSQSKDFAKAGINAFCNGGEVDFDDKIILDKTFTDNEKLKCVYDRLLKDNVVLFKSTVGTFIDDPEFNLTFKVGDCNQTDDQCTDRTDPYNITITFEDVIVNPIEIAQAILHEAIHAEIARYVTRYDSGVDINNRARLFELYKYYKEYYDTGDIQHIYMTEKYINPIANALRQIDGNKYPLDYYKSFAWDGLRAWDANNLLSMQMDDVYYDYRSIINENTTVCN